MSAFIGFSGKLEVDDGVSSAFVEVDQVTMVKVPDAETEQKDASYLNMPTRDRIYIPGLNASADFEFEANYLKASLTRLEAIKGTLKNWKITHSASSVTVTFAAFLKTASVEFKVDDVSLIKAKCQVTGAVTVA